MRDTMGMTQLAHARMLNFLQDTIGLDRVDAEFVMKRLYDAGFEHRSRGHVHRGGSPPVAEVATEDGDDTPLPRAALIERMRREVSDAQTRAAEAEEAGRKAAEEAEVAERARVQRALAVQQVLAGMSG